MTIEEVDVVYPHTFQALVERGHQVFAAAPFTIRTRPHVIAGLCGDEELVAVGPEVFIHQASHRLLGRAVDRPVVVGQVEMGDTVVEGVVGNLAATLVGVDASEVMPEAEAYLRQQHTRASATLILHPVVVAVIGREIHLLHLFQSFFSFRVQIYENFSYLCTHKQKSNDDQRKNAVLHRCRAL